MSRDYRFPYEPYAIQGEFMDWVYRVLSEGGVGAVESPTGTGKSLSLICSTLTYLEDAKRLSREKLVKDLETKLGETMKNEPEWVIEHEMQRQTALYDDAEREFSARLERVYAERKRQQQSAKKSAKRRHIDVTYETEGDEKFAPAMYDSNGLHDPTDIYTPEVKALMAQLTIPDPRHRPDAKDDTPSVQKIFFTSRTHSQLSQFISELRKTEFSRSFRRHGSDVNLPVRTIPLGSRRNLCINDDVISRSKGNPETLNDLCLDLQRGESGGKRCPYLPSLDEVERLDTFRDHAFAAVHDISDLEDLGRNMKTCPYYGARHAVKTAELVTLPYNLLIQKSARESLGIDVTGHVIVVDEAHNLIDTVLSLHHSTITNRAMEALTKALIKYVTRFKSRLKGLNATYLRQLLIVTKALSQFARQWADAAQSKTQLFRVNELMQQLKSGAVDQVNFIKLDQYLQESRVIQKIAGYVEYEELEMMGVTTSEASHNAEGTRKSSHKGENTRGSTMEGKTGVTTLRHQTTRQFQQIQQFLVSLTHAEADGRVLLTVGRPDRSDIGGQDQSALSKPSDHHHVDDATPVTITWKYMLLSPSESFRTLAEQSHAVVLAGGTMAPMTDFKKQLFPFVAHRFDSLSCGHIIPPDQIAPLALAKGPTGTVFKFTYENRKDLKLLDELARTISNIARLVPKGIVVFVPSYDFLSQIQTRWKETKATESIEKRKKIFWEPKESTQVEQVLREYASANASGSQPVSGEGATPPDSPVNGGILFAVVGAKLSEGINFADDMARCVVICGIPYPNLHSTELSERIKYLESKEGLSAGKTYYQNLAFRAVNQSIGRAIRHINDWSSIVLLDIRYTDPAKQRQLPKWIGDYVETPETFGQFIRTLSQFCTKRKGQ